MCRADDGSAGRKGLLVLVGPCAVVPVIDSPVAAPPISSAKARALAGRRACARRRLAFRGTEHRERLS